MCILCKFTSYQSWNFRKMKENWQKTGKIWVSLRVLVLMKYEIRVQATPVQCGYRMRTRTVRVFVNTRLDSEYFLPYFLYLLFTKSCNEVRFWIMKGSGFLFTKSSFGSSYFGTSQDLWGSPLLMIGCDITICHE